MYNRGACSHYGSQGYGDSHIIIFVELRFSFFLFNSFVWILKQLFEKFLVYQYLNKIDHKLAFRWVKRSECAWWGHKFLCPRGPTSGHAAWLTLKKLLFLRYSMSKNVVTLKSGSKATQGQGHWEWYHSIHCVWFPISVL